MNKQLEKVLSLSQIQTLCQTPTSPQLPRRHDKLLETVLLMAYLGLRVSEAINFTGQTVPVENKPAFLVHGKGNKDRLVFNLLNHPYITKKAKNLPPIHGTTISRVAVGNYLTKQRLILKLDGKITPHTLRRSFASILQYDLGLDASSIQQLLGHSHFRTTERYLKKDPRFLLTNLQRKGFLL